MQPVVDKFLIDIQWNNVSYATKKPIMQMSEYVNCSISSRLNVVLSDLSQLSSLTFIDTNCPFLNFHKLGAEQKSLLSYLSRETDNCCYQDLLMTLSIVYV